jgi:hypothetical protein
MQPVQLDFRIAFFFRGEARGAAAFFDWCRASMRHGAALWRSGFHCLRHLFAIRV